MSIVTKSGDDGLSSLFGGQRVPKDHPRLEAYGCVDEAQSAIGVLRAQNGIPPDVDSLLARLQRELFVIGADLATPDPEVSVPRVTSTMIDALESECHRIERDLPELSSFILPASSPEASAGAFCFWARSVVRRAERRIAVLMSDGQDVSAALIYMNRLGDLLFLLGRFLTKNSGLSEETWSGRVG